MLDSCALAQLWEYELRTEDSMFEKDGMFAGDGLFERDAFEGQKGKSVRTESGKLWSACMRMQVQGYQGGSAVWPWLVSLYAMIDQMQEV